MSAHRLPKGFVLREVVHSPLGDYRAPAIPERRVLVVERRWATEADKALALLGVTGFAALLAIPQGRTLETIVLAFLITVYCAVRFSNRTSLTVDRGITVRHTPLPIFAQSTIGAADIRQILSEEVRPDGRPTFRVVAITRDEKRVTLVEKLDTPEQAAFLVKEIEARLLA